MGNFFLGKPVTGALLACVPLAAVTASRGYAKGSKTGRSSASIVRGVNKGNEAGNYWKKTSLIDDENKADKDFVSKTFRKGDDIGMKDMNGSVSESLAEALGGVLGVKSDAELDSVIKSMAKDITDKMSMNNVIEDLSKFNIGNERVSLSVSDFSSEKKGLASAFLKSKKTGCYDTDWVSSFPGSVDAKGKSTGLSESRLSGIFGSMKGVAAAGLANFFTVKDKASGNVAGQINFASDPNSRGTVKLGAWADSEENFTEAFALALKGLSKNQGVNKVVVSATDTSGEKLDSVLKKIAGSRSERFKKLKVVENENHMELVKDLSGNYKLLNYKIKTVDGKPVVLKDSDIQQQEVSLDGVEGAKKLLDSTRKMFSIMSSNTIKSLKRPDLIGNVEIVDSFVVKMTDYEFTESD